MTTDFERVGGEPGLRAVIADFVGRLFTDPMIGFLFRRVNRDRLEALEYEHAAAHLGGGVVYTGRPLADAHRAHRIFGGQFDRRSRLLEKTLEAHGVPEDVRVRWLAHVESLRAHITGDRPGECAPPGKAPPPAA